MAIIFVEDDSITVRELMAKVAAGDRVVIRHDGIAIAEVNAVDSDCEPAKREAAEKEAA